MRERRFCRNVEPRSTAAAVALGSVRSATRPRLPLRERQPRRQGKPRGQSPRVLLGGQSAGHTSGPQLQRIGETFGTRLRRRLLMSV